MSLRMAAKVKQELDYEEDTICNDQWLLDNAQVKEEKPKLFSKESLNCKFEVSEEDEIDETQKADVKCFETQWQKKKSLKKTLLNSEIKKEAIELNDTGIISWEKAIEEAPVSDEVHDLCKYKCQKCHKTLPPKYKISLHIRKTQSCFAWRPELNKCLTKVVAHKCKICFDRILCDKLVIFQHLKYKHRFNNLKQYVILTKEEIMLHQLKMKREECKKRNKYGNIDSAPVSEAVGNLCTYKCKVCKIKYNSRDSIRHHFKESRHSDTTENSVSSSIIKTVAHQCCICKKLFVCDRAVLVVHFRMHKISSIKAYMEKYNVNEASNNLDTHHEINKLCKTSSVNHEISKQVKNLCKYSCLKCNYSCRAWTTMGIHVSSKRHGPRSNITRHLTRVIFHQCHICSELTICDIAFIKSHVRKHNLAMSAYYTKAKQPQFTVQLYQEYVEKLEQIIQEIPVVQAQEHYVLNANALSEDIVTMDVGNISIFKCTQCDKSLYRSFSSLLRHCKVAHLLKRLQYRPSHVVEARYHRCHICAKIVLCDNSHIILHIRNSHKMPFGPYTKNYVLESGHRVIPTFDEFNRDNDIFEKLSCHSITEKVKRTGNNSLILPSMISSESEESDENV